MVVPHKVPAGSSLTESMRLVIDYCELNKQLPKVQMLQAKTNNTIMLIEKPKIDHIWAKLKGTIIRHKSQVSSHFYSLRPET